MEPVETAGRNYCCFVRFRLFPAPALARERKNTRNQGHLLSGWLGGSFHWPSGRGVNRAGSYLWAKGRLVILRPETAGLAGLLWQATLEQECGFGGRTGASAAHCAMHCVRWLWIWGISVDCQLPAD